MKKMCIRDRGKGGSGVNACLQLAVEHVECFGVAAEQLHLGDEVGGIFFFLALLLDKPVEELNSAEIICRLGGDVYKRQGPPLWAAFAITGY